MIDELRDQLNELENDLLEKNWERARAIAGNIQKYLDTIIDDIDEGRFK